MGTIGDKDGANSIATRRSGVSSFPHCSLDHEGEGWGSRGFHEDRGPAGRPRHNFACQSRGVAARGASPEIPRWWSSRKGLHPGVQSRGMTWWSEACPGSPTIPIGHWGLLSLLLPVGFSESDNSSLISVSNFNSGFTFLLNVFFCSLKLFHGNGLIPMLGAYVR